MIRRWFVVSYVCFLYKAFSFLIHECWFSIRSYSFWDFVEFLCCFLIILLYFLDVLSFDNRFEIYHSRFLILYYQDTVFFSCFWQFRYVINEYFFLNLFRTSYFMFDFLFIIVSFLLTFHVSLYVLSYVFDYFVLIIFLFDFPESLFESRVFCCRIVVIIS